MEYHLRNSSGQELKIQHDKKSDTGAKITAALSEGYEILSIGGQSSKKMQQDFNKQLQDLQKKVNPKPSKREQRRRIDEIIKNRSKKIVGPEETKNFTGEDFRAGIVTGDKIRASAERVQEAIREAGNRSDK